MSNAQPAVGTDPRQDHAGAGSSLRLGGKAHGVFDGACCILNLRVHSRLGGSTANRWALLLSFMNRRVPAAVIFSRND
jgi:hypothetical protein